MSSPETRTIPNIFAAWAPAQPKPFTQPQAAPAAIESATPEAPKALGPSDIEGVCFGVTDVVPDEGPLHIPEPPPRSYFEDSGTTNSTFFGLVD